ncbi:diphthamide biosynthesis protein 3-like isoform X2 [Tachypleus tridentatus]|uniref:diphthamide biosynthesis protein 3-like isoform X2 n=1 Tax=Tachypleus tridentatus TaxID=6853 RepID=UPI003FCFAE37
MNGHHFMEVRLFLLICHEVIKNQEDLENGEEVATCPSCSLIVKVIYDPEDFFTEDEKNCNVQRRQLEIVQ